LSPNIKERRDYSCAVFDMRGALAAQAAHIPVHLGSTPLAVRAVLERVTMGPGDVVIVNDPFAGGTHLPDVTLVAPVFLPRARRPFAYVANRAHHADMGGMSPGSMPLATEIFQEGFRLPPVRLVCAGRVVADVLALFLANTRVPAEREGDLMAQWAALRVGADRLCALAAARGVRRLAAEIAALQAYSAALLRPPLARLPPGPYRPADVPHDDVLGASRLPIAVAIRLRRRPRRRQEQPGPWGRRRRVLRDAGGGCRPPAARGGPLRRAQPHDEHYEHADRGPRGVLSAPGTPLRRPARVRRRRPPSRRRRRGARDRAPGADGGDAPRRAETRAAVRARRGWSGRHGTRLGRARRAGAPDRREGDVRRRTG